MSNDYYYEYDNGYYAAKNEIRIALNEIILKYCMIQNDNIQNFIKEIRSILK